MKKIGTSTSDRNRIREMYEAGDSVEKIASVLNVVPGPVRRYIDTLEEVEVEVEAEVGVEEDLDDEEDED